MNSRSYARKTLRPEMTVRQVVVDYPDSEPVFRKYGERDSPPSRFGHLEPLTHFARRRGLSIESLLAELAAATGVPVELSGRFAERVHHGFLLSSLVLTLSLGAGWGAWLLWRIGMQGAFDAVPAAHVIAHGEAQLWGFIVLFVMGVSLRTVLQGITRLPWGVWLCRGLLGLAIVGIVASMYWSLYPKSLPAMGLVAAALLLVMALVFWGLQGLLLRTKWPATWARAVLLSGWWLTAWAAFTVWLRWNAGDAGPGIYTYPERLLLIELAVFGFAMNSIYGFGQMLLPGLLRIGSPRLWAIELAHWLHNAGVIVVCLATANTTSGQAMVAGSALLVGGAVMFAIGHRGFVGRHRTSYAAEKGHALLDFFPPLAFSWLLAALALMAGGTLYEANAGGSLPHAYMGAVRHALTVGFMTTLILGVGQRIVPVLDRTVLALPGLAAPILLLIGVGNLLRVGSELAILVTPTAFRMMPISALFEWSALLLFAICTTATMFHRDPLHQRGRVTKRSSLAVLLAEHPWIEERLRPTGSRYLERARCIPDELTIASFAIHEEINSTEFVATINTWLAEGPPAGGNSDSSASHSQQHKLEGSRT